MPGEVPAVLRYSAFPAFPAFPARPGGGMGRPSRLLLDLPPGTDRSHVTGTGHPLDPPT